MTSSSPAMRHRDLLGLEREVLGRGRAPGRSPRGRCRRAGRTRRPGRRRPGRDGDRATSADSSRRKSTCSSASIRTPVRRRGRERGGARAGVADDPDALAVVAAARGLEHAREAATDSATASTSLDAPRCRGQRDAELGRAVARITRLVLRVHERLGSGSARRRPRPRARAGAAVGTCSWSKVTTAQPSATEPQGVEVAVVAHRRVADHLGRGDARGLGEQPQREAERDGRLGHHPCQLATTDDGDEAGRGVAHW